MFCIILLYVVCHAASAYQAKLLVLVSIDSGPTHWAHHGKTKGGGLEPAEPYASYAPVNGSVKASICGWVYDTTEELLGIMECAPSQNGGGATWDHIQQYVSELDGKGILY